MKRWLAMKLQSVVTRLTEPVAARLLDRIDAAARENRDLHDITMVRVEALRDTLAQHGESTRREIVETAGRDLGVVVRMLAAMDARVADLQATLKPEAREDARQTHPIVLPAPVPATRYVTFLGAEDDRDGAGASAFLRALRRGLDRLEDVLGEQPEIWIEHPRASGGVEGGALPSEVYIRVMKSGTRFIEVMRPGDALAVRQALDRNQRSDVQVVYRWLGTVPPGSGEQTVRQALACADHWIFPSQDLCDMVQAANGPAAKTRVQRPVYIHLLPDPAKADPVVLAHTYRASVTDVLGEAARQLEKS